MSDPDPFDHYRPTADADAPDGVYRVVGTPDDAVTLLRVTDERQRRVASGRVIRVPASTLNERFDPVSDPDAASGVAGLVRAVAAFGDWLGEKLLGSR